MALNKFQKVTTGFVVQTFEKKGGKFICTSQEFVASDDVVWEDMDGNALGEFHEQQVPEHDYQPYYMNLSGRQ